MSRKNTPTPFFWLLCVFSCGVLFSEEFPECFVKQSFSHKECGTVADSNYREALYSLKDAIKLSFPTLKKNGFERPHFFPGASDSVRDGCNNNAFYYEGSLSWEISNAHTCKRVMHKAAQIDVPRHIFQENDNSIFYPPKPIFTEEERIFKFRKDYSLLFSCFLALKEDLAFTNESNETFLHRRLQDFWRYYSSGGYISIPLRLEDVKERLQYYEKRHQRIAKRVEEYQEKATVYCKRSLDYCIDHHDDPLAHIDRGFFDYFEGNSIEALDRVNIALKKANVENLEALKDHALLLKGRSELEVGLYTDAVLTLTELIDKYPDNKDAYLDRAEAYFETGNFDSSLEDYLTSGVKPEPISAESFEMLAFAAGLREGIAEGGIQATIEFIPSLLSSLQGLSQGLWAFAADPVPMSNAFIQSLQNCINFIKEHSLTETFLELAPEVKELFAKWDTLENEQRGKLTGQIIGKYSIEIFAGACIAKITKAYRELKRANNLMTFEAMAISERNKSLLKLEAAKKAQARKEVLQHANLKIQPDKQGKHRMGHPNYSDKKSILEHPNPQKLVDDFAGKGMKITNLSPGVPGYQEVVNFGEFIGYDVNPNTGEKIATTWGKIHYAKDGTHVVPTKSRQ